MQEAAAEPGTAVFADQFDNAANFRAHLRTGEEIWQQTGGTLDAFVSGAGTGGTIAGVSHQLKTRNPFIKVTLTLPLEHNECCQAKADSLQHGLRLSTNTVLLQNPPCASQWILSVVSVAPFCECVEKMLTLPVGPIYSFNALIIQLQIFVAIVLCPGKLEIPLPGNLHA